MAAPPPRRHPTVAELRRDPERSRRRVVSAAEIHEWGEYHATEAPVAWTKESWDLQGEYSFTSIRCNRNMRIEAYYPFTDPARPNPELLGDWYLINVAAFIVDDKQQPNKVNIEMIRKAKTQPMKPVQQDAGSRVRNEHTPVNLTTMHKLPADMVSTEGCFRNAIYAVMKGTKHMTPPRNLFFKMAKLKSTTYLEKDKLYFANNWVNFELAMQTAKNYLGLSSLPKLDMSAVATEDIAMDIVKRGPAKYMVLLQCLDGSMTHVVSLEINQHVGAIVWDGSEPCALQLCTETFDHLCSHGGGFLGFKKIVKIV